MHINTIPKTLAVIATFWLSSIYGASSSSMNLQNKVAVKAPSYSVNKTAMQEFIRLVWDDVYNNATLKQFYDNIIGTDKVNKAAQNKIKTMVQNAFEESWEQHIKELKSNSPITPLNTTTTIFFKQQVKSLITKMFIENEVLNIMNTCVCIPMPDRISYTFILADDIRQKFRNSQQRIVITAFASGLPLQEYLLLSLLTAYGYNNLVLNVIDLGYPDPVMLQRLINKTGKANAQRAIKHYKKQVITATNLQTKNKEQKQKWIDENKKLFPELAKLLGMGEYDSGYGYQKALDHFKALLPNIKINTFGNMHEYIELTKRNGSLKADVITIVDPDLNLFDIAPFPSEANLIGITNKTIWKKQDPQYAPHIFVTLAKNKPIQIFVHAKTYNEAKNNDVFINDMHKLVSAAKTTEANKAYNTKFRDWLITTFNVLNAKAITSLLNKNAQLLKKARVKDITDKQLNTILEELMHANAAIFNRTYEQLENVYKKNLPKQTMAQRIDFGLKAIGRMKERLDNIKNAYELIWYSDPHLAFQELVQEAAKNDAIIYLYYQDDPIAEYNLPFILERVKKSDYIKRDVFGPNVGRMLMQAGINEESDEYDDIILEDSSDDLNSYYDDDDYIDDDIFEVNPDDQYGRIDLKTGKLIIWDQIKQKFPPLDHLRAPKMKPHSSHNDMNQGDHIKASTSTYKPEKL